MVVASFIHLTNTYGGSTRCQELRVLGSQPGGFENLNSLPSTCNDTPEWMWIKGLKQDPGDLAGLTLTL